MKRKLIPPQDPNKWTVEDWRILYQAMESVKRKVAKNHERKPVPQAGSVPAMQLAATDAEPKLLREVPAS